MPIRVYRCPYCENVVEIIENIKESRKTHKCDECDNKMERVLTASNFHLHGTGWYVTDYKNKGTTKSKKEGD